MSVFLLMHFPRKPWKVINLFWDLLVQLFLPQRVLTEFSVRNLACLLLRKKLVDYSVTKDLSICIHSKQERVTCERYVLFETRIIKNYQRSIIPYLLYALTFTGLPDYEEMKSSSGRLTSCFTCVHCETLCFMFNLKKKKLFIYVSIMSLTLDLKTKLKHWPAVTSFL